MAAETKYSANTGLVTINVANSSLAGGTIGTNIFTVLTGASNGTLIKTITIKAIGTPSQGMVRLWIYDGTTQRLFKEIDVNPVEQASSDVSFEKKIMLDYKISSGYSLLASTQNGDSFNIIAEGLDFSYNSTYVRPETARYTVTTGVAAVSVGTSSMTGSGSTLLLTATSSKSGTVIESIKIKATGPTSADGMIRIFINKEPNYYLLTEVFVPYSAQTGIYQSFEHTIVFPETFQLKAGLSLYVSTQNSDSFHVVANAMNWGNPASNPNTVNYAPVTISSTTTETILHGYQMGATGLKVGDLISLYAQVSVNNNANTKTFRIYVNTSEVIAGATLLATHISTSVAGDNIERLFPIISDTSLECYGGASTDARNQYGTTLGTSGTTTVPSVSAGFWIFITGQNASATDTTTIVWSTVEKIF